MIPRREFDTKFLECIRNIPPNTALHELTAAFIVVVLERNKGNRTHTSNEIKMPIRTLREHLKYIEALGYDVPKYQQQWRERYFTWKIL